MTNIVFHPLAEGELFDATVYYEKQEKGLGQQYLEEVENLVNFLRRYPQAGSIVQGSIRRLILPKFPYSLLYRILENNQIRVLALAHHKRRPEYWINRD